jgi:hypothetical protein
MAGGRKHDSPEAARAIGERRGHNRDPAWDTSEAETLNGCSNERSCLHSMRATIEEFRAAGLLACGKAMARLTAVFSANHVVPCMNVASVVRVTAVIRELSQAARRLWTVRESRLRQCSCVPGSF